MLPDLLLTYECGEVDLRVYKVGDEHAYFIKAGAAGIELTNETLQNLFDVLEGARDDVDFMEVFYAHE
jgi:hypothetical protein